MTDPKEKPKSSLREPKPKKSFGLSVERRVPFVRSPHDDLIKVEAPSLTSKGTQTNKKMAIKLPPPCFTPPPLKLINPRPTSHTTEQPIAPVRDFTRVANSISREAVPSGAFRGKSKQLYDCLYSLTRGAIVPVRAVRISRPRLMKKAHIGSRVTFETNISHLQTIGLIAVRQIIGEHEGNEYTVLLPEEIGSTPSPTGQTRHAQKVDRVVRPEISQTRHTSNVAVSDGYTPPNTFLKTEGAFDDEAVPKMLREAESEVTGKESSAASWNQVFEVLATELKIAATRTHVSSAPAFLAEHLRRRLNKAPTSTSPAPSARTEPVSERVEPAPPTPEEIIDTYVNFRHSGMSSDEIDALLSPSVDPKLWPQIRQAAIERYEAERGAVRPPQTPAE